MVVQTAIETKSAAAETATAPLPAVLGPEIPPQHTAMRTRKASHNEAQLVERLKAGDEQAFESIYNLYASKLYNVAQKILSDAADAEETVQDVFWTAYRKAKTFQGNSRLSTWLYRLTVNAALGKIRRRKRSKETEYEELLPKFQKDGHHAVRPVVDWSDTVEQVYAKQETQAMINQALDELKPLDRSIVVLSDLEGMSDKEIAAVSDLTVSAVKTRLHRARLFLRGRLAVKLGYSAS
jgi:RNA polymerase sigma-70 factor (ECF subfamily)